MNPDMIIHHNDKLFYTVCRNDDNTNNGSISIERSPGHVYCIAKAPKYASNEEWIYNAELIIKAINEMHEKNKKLPPPPMMNKCNDCGYEFEDYNDYCCPVCGSDDIDEEVII